MPRLSLGLGMQSTRKVGGGAAPSGLLVASTPSIVVVGSGGVSSGIYNVQDIENPIGTVASTQWLAGFPPFYNITQAVPNTDIYFFLGPNASLLDFEGSNYYVNGSNWKIFRLYNNEGATVSSVGTNPSINADYIPTSGWSPSITITAA
jgi:hypothetical protein